MKIFSVYDHAAKAFIAPFYLPMVEQATRTFFDCANDKDHAFCKHPDDYELFLFGEFDETTGVFDLQLTPESLGRATNFKEVSK